MATIENQGRVTPHDFLSEMSSMSDAQLIAQDVMQQGAVHAVSWLLANGCTEARAAEMLASLRANAALIREEAKRRGRPSMFPSDQTVFS